METLRNTIVNQLRKITNMRGLAITGTEQPSVETLLADKFGQRAPTRMTLKRLYSTRTIETRVPSPAEFHQFANLLGVPAILLMVNTDQPYETSPLSEERKLVTHLQVFAADQDWIINGIDGLRVSESFTSDFSTLAAAYGLLIETVQLSQLTEEYRRSENEAVAVIAVNMLDRLLTLATRLLTTDGLYYPFEERETVRSAILEAELVLPLTCELVSKVDTYRTAYARQEQASTIHCPKA